MMETIEPKLESLLMNKAFTALDAHEREYVSAYLNENDYTAYRAILKHTAAFTQECDDILTPAADIPTTLKAGFMAVRKPAIIFGISLQQLTLAASIILAVSLGILFFKSGKQITPADKSAQSRVHSTRPEPAQVQQPLEIPEKPSVRKLVTYRKAKKVNRSAVKPEPPETPVAEKETIVPLSEQFLGIDIEVPMPGLQTNEDDQLLGLTMGNQL